MIRTRGKHRGPGLFKLIGLAIIGALTLSFL